MTEAGLRNYLSINSAIIDRTLPNIQAKANVVTLIADKGYRNDEVLTDALLKILSVYLVREILEGIQES